MKRLLILCALLTGSTFRGSAQELPALLVDPGTGSQLQLSWADSPGTIVLEESDTLSLWGTFQQPPTLLNGRLSVTVDITKGRTRFFRLRRSQTSGLPPDPASVASLIPHGVATQLAGATQFLYTGPNPIQTGVAPGTLEVKRAAVVRGKVSQRDNTPLSGVSVSILNHPEFGQTLSRADGMFDLAVNGGGLLTVNYQKADFCPIQRQFNAPWQDYVTVQDIVMLPMDPIVTPIVLGLNSPMQVHQGSMQTDADGARKATLIFKAGTCGSLVLADGTTQDCRSISVRATEFTAGANGPAAMPATLPPSSGYTYCVELTADEAIAAGAKEVRFATPVPFYVENFVGFPVGSQVPLGSYDRDKGQWVASNNGRVIKVISITGGKADLDLDGNGTIDDATALAALGIADDERGRLATLYAPGKELWRVLIPHFSPWDCNWSLGPPPGSEPPGNGKPKPGPKPDKPPKGGPNKDCGSIIGSESQTLGEVINVTGTPFRLHYQSDRVPGRRTSHLLKVRLSGATLPPGLQHIYLEITVAGRAFTKDFPPQLNLIDTFTWDGKDAYGRAVQGKQPVRVRIGYAYVPQYYATQDTVEASFNRFGLPPIAGGSGGGTVLFSRPSVRTTTPLIILSQVFEDSLGALDIPDLGGWGLSVLHSYDVGGRTLYLGNGDQRSASIVGPVINSIGRIPDPWGIAEGSDGSLYIASASTNRIRRLGTDGNVTTFAGLPQGGSSGDGGPATQAQLSTPRGVAIGPDGSVYIPESSARVRRVGPDGIITTVAGTGVSGYSGDGGPATQAQLNDLRGGIAVGPDGSLYIADTWNHRIRRVGTDGIITTVAGTGVPGYAEPGVPATRCQLDTPAGIAVGTDGTLYITNGLYSQLLKVSTDGVITQVADRQFTLGPSSVTVGPDGSVYFTNYNNLIYRAYPDGTVTTVAGAGDFGESGDSGPANQALLGNPKAVAVGSDGSLFISDTLNNRIRKIGPPLPGVAAGEISIAAEDGSEVYIFTDRGRHLRTLDALTGAVRFEFTYGSADRLATIKDGSGNVTAIERDGSGIPTAIVAPFGQRTTLAVNADGYLSRVTNPAGEAVQLTYNTGNADGLLVTLTDPCGLVHRYFYDALGRLVRDDNPAGGVTFLARSDINDDYYSVTLTTALGLVTTYEVEELSTGDTRRVRIDRSGARTESLYRTDGSHRVTYADGTVAELVEGPDPRFGMQVPILKAATVTMPGGMTSSRSATRTATLTDPTNVLGLTSQTDTVQMNDRVYTRLFDAASRTITISTPAGRQHVVTLDAKGRRIQAAAAGLTPVQLSYDDHGSLASITQGDRAYILAYNPQGLLSLLTDPLTHEFTYNYDDAGRATRITRPDSEHVQFAYGANGNMAALMPPGRNAHTFTFTPVNLLQSYTPPALPGSATGRQYTFDIDRRLTQMVGGDSVVTLAYNAAGQLQSMTSPQDTLQATYDAPGRLQSLATTSGIGLTYGHDGSLLTGTSWTGLVTGSVQRTFDKDRRVTARTVNGAHGQSFTYDADGLLSEAGALTLQRSAQNGLLTGTALGLVSDVRSYNGFGEWASYSAMAGATALFSAQYTRDQAGRVAQLDETMGGAATTSTYSYDLAGRLTEVKTNGVTTSVSTYDANGNRLTHTVGGVKTSGSYDAQDRLMQYGGTTFTYSANGDLFSATSGGQTTEYAYDVLGNLRGVTLPGGTRIDYLIDGRQRRIGKVINGTKVQGFLYQSRLQPIAELDGGNTLISTFVYGSRLNVPDYMVKGGATYRIIADHLGSPRLVVDTATGTIAQRLDYDESGKVRTDTNPGFQPFGFAGGLYDRDTGLVRFGARDYDPDTGRWTAKDASGLATGFNLYTYANGDPVNYLDVSGRVPVAAGVIAFGTAAGGTAFGLGATSAFIATAAIIGVPVAIGILATASIFDSAQGDQTGDDEGEKEGGAPPQDGEADGGSCPNTPLVPQGKTDPSGPPDEAIPDDFLTNPTFPKPGRTPRIPYPETPEDGLDPNLEFPYP